MSNLGTELRWAYFSGLASLVCWLVVGLQVARTAVADRAALQLFAAQDTLQPADDPSVDARDCLDGFTWSPSAFQVECEPTPRADHDWLVRFPSPVTSGEAANDRVTVEWYAACDKQGDVKRAPAVVVVHESGHGMIGGRFFARSLRTKGLHAFMVQLPTYGERRSVSSGRKIDVATLFRQGVADIRRTRDAVAALPNVDAENVGLQGTSLGGFAASLASSLDNGFDRTFLVLAGGQLHRLVQEGQADAARFRRRLLERGHNEADLAAMFQKIEPTRIAHRLNPATTWLYSARDDQVVRPKFADALAKSAGLDGEHHLYFPGDHYTVFLYFPKLLDHIVEQVMSTASEISTTR